MSTRATVGDYIALEWCDGPLLEIAAVDFADGHRLVQVQALCTVHDTETSPGARPCGTVSGKEPWRRAVIRLTRDHLQAMMDLLDGKVVKDFHDR